MKRILPVLVNKRWYHPELDLPEFADESALEAYCESSSANAVSLMNRFFAKAREMASPNA